MKIKKEWEQNKILNKTILSFRVKDYFAIFVICIIGSLLLSFSTGFLASFRIFFGALLYLFLPGYLITHIFFQKDKIDNLERIALSFALSISVIPLIIFYLNLAGIEITTLNTFLVILGVSVLAVAIIRFRLRKNQSKK